LQKLNFTIRIESLFNFFLNLRSSFSSFFFLISFSFVNLPQQKILKNSYSHNHKIRKKFIYILPKRDRRKLCLILSSLVLSVCLIYTSKSVISDSHHSFLTSFSASDSSLSCDPVYTFMSIAEAKLRIRSSLPALVRFPSPRRVKRRRVVSTKRNRKPAVSSAVHSRQRQIIHRPCRWIR